MKHMLQVAGGLLLVVSLLIGRSTSSVHAQRPSDADSPAAAKIVGQPVSEIPAGTAQWFQFDYNFTNDQRPRPPVTVRLQHGARNGLQFEVWATERLQGTWLENEPVGRGMPEIIAGCSWTLSDGSVIKCMTDDLVWVGGFGALGTYYIRILNTSDSPIAPQVIVSGPGLGQCTNPAPSASSSLLETRAGSAGFVRVQCEFPPENLALVSQSLPASTTFAATATSTPVAAATQAVIPTATPSTVTSPIQAATPTVTSPAISSVGPTTTTTRPASPTAAVSQTGTATPVSTQVAATIPTATSTAAAIRTAGATSVAVATQTTAATSTGVPTRTLAATSTVVATQTTAAISTLAAPRTTAATSTVAASPSTAAGSPSAPPVVASATATPIATATAARTATATLVASAVPTRVPTLMPTPTPAPTPVPGLGQSQQNRVTLDITISADGHLSVGGIDLTAFGLEPLSDQATQLAKQVDSAHLVVQADLVTLDIHSTPLLKMQWGPDSRQVVVTLAAKYGYTPSPEELARVEEWISSSIMDVTARYTNEASKPLQASLTKPLWIDVGPEGQVMIERVPLALRLDANSMQTIKQSGYQNVLLCWNKGTLKTKADGKELPVLVFDAKGTSALSQSFGLHVENGLNPLFNSRFGLDISLAGGIHQANASCGD